jgi:dipeptidyl aminopeptidase/acylaminoacyl peptidase
MRVRSQEQWQQPELGPRLSTLTYGVLTLVGAACGDGTSAVAPSPASGLVVTVKTTGPSQDPDGYTILVDGTIQARLTGLSGDTAWASSGFTGPHVVRISEISSNCSAQTPLADSVSVAGAVTRVEFRVACSVPTGEIAVRLHGTSAALASGRLQIALDWTDTLRAAPGDSAAFGGLFDGMHSLAFIGFAPFCGLDAGNPVLASVSGAPVLVDVDPRCSAPLTSGILFDDGGQVRAVSADGSVEAIVASNPYDGGGRWSPDGAAIAFTSGRSGQPEIWVQRTDGSPPTQITHGGARDPAWSPDGRAIAYVNDGLYVAAADGQAPRRLVNGPAGRPAWSPDGQLLVFERRERCVVVFIDPVCALNLYVVRTDGSGLASLTQFSAGRGASQPSWRPDGSMIAYIGTNLPGVPSPTLRLIAPDGTDFTPLSAVAGTNSQISAAAWSPDGKSLAVGLPDGIGILPVVGGSLTVISGRVGAPTSWR